MVNALPDVARPFSTSLVTEVAALSFRDYRYRYVNACKISARSHRKTTRYPRDELPICTHTLHVLHLRRSLNAIITHRGPLHAYLVRPERASRQLGFSCMPLPYKAIYCCARCHAASSVTSLLYSVTGGELRPVTGSEPHAVTGNEPRAMTVRLPSAHICCRRSILILFFLATSFVRHSAARRLVSDIPINLRSPSSSACGRHRRASPLSSTPARHCPLSNYQDLRH